MLSVQTVPETNLVELAAVGYQAEILAPIINTWIDIYLQRRADQVRQSTGLTLDTLREELTGLEDKILIKRDELAHFREVNEISRLQKAHIDFAADIIHVIGEDPRTIPLTPTLKALFEQTEPCPAWNKNQNVTSEILEAILIYATVNAGFSETLEINAESITHT